MKTIRSLPKKAFTMNQSFYQDNRVDGWNPGEQHQVFLELLKVSDYAKRSFEDASVLDVGCGTGRLLSVLARNGIRRYVGIDILENAITEARKSDTFLTSLDVTFLVQDPLTWSPKEQFDFVFASGALSLNLASIEIDNYDFMKEMIRRMWSWTKVGLVFNFLLDTLPNPGTELFFYDKHKIEDICYETIKHKDLMGTTTISLSDLKMCTVFLLKNSKKPKSVSEGI